MNTLLNYTINNKDPKRAITKDSLTIFTLLPHIAGELSTGKTLSNFKVSDDRFKVYARYNDEYHRITFSLHNKNSDMQLTVLGWEIPLTSIKEEEYLNIKVYKVQNNHVSQWLRDLFEPSTSSDAAPATGPLFSNKFDSVQTMNQTGIQQQQQQVNSSASGSSSSEGSSSNLQSNQSTPQPNSQTNGTVDRGSDTVPSVSLAQHNNRISSHQSSDSGNVVPMVRSVQVVEPQHDSADENKSIPSTGHIDSQNISYIKLETQECMMKKLSTIKNRCKLEKSTLAVKQEIIQVEHDIDLLKEQILIKEQLLKCVHQSLPKIDSIIKSVKQEEEVERNSEIERFLQDLRIKKKEEDQV